VDALKQVDSWPGERAAVGVVGVLEAQHGETNEAFRWTSVTKLATAVAVLVAVEEGIVQLETPAGPPGSTVRHLLAHASGLPFDDGPPIARPGVRRIYSNAGFDVLADVVAERAGMPFTDYFASVWPEGPVLRGSAGSGAEGTLGDLLRLARELLEPQRLSAQSLAEATTVQFSGLEGVLPGFGRMSPNDWGLGFELRDGKSPHWTGTRNSPRTFGHFGRSGTFLWVDPDAGLACGCLTDLLFGAWAKDAWPRLGDSLLATASARG
jgi:CubicO group peptidase (beta-lactamase class C family)